MGLFRKKPKMLTYDSARGPIKYMEYISDEYLPDDLSLLHDMYKAYDLLNGRGKYSLSRRDYYHLAIRYFTVQKYPADSYEIDKKFELGYELLRYTSKHSPPQQLYHNSHTYYFEDYSENERLEMGYRMYREALEAALRHPEAFGETIIAYAMCYCHVMLGFDLDDMFKILENNFRSTTPGCADVSKNIFEVFHSDMDIFYDKVMRDDDRGGLPDYLPELLRAAKITLEEYFEIAKQGLNNAHLLLHFCQNLQPGNINCLHLRAGHALDCLAIPYQKKYGRMGLNHAIALVRRGAEAGLPLYKGLVEVAAEWER